MNRFRRYRDIVLVVLLLAVPFFFLRSSIRNPEDLNAIDRTLLRVSAPVEYAAAALARVASNVLSGYVYLVDVKADDNKLAYENARLRGDVRRLSAAETENRRLRRLLTLRETAKAETVSAVVIGKDITEFFRVAHVVLDNSAPGIRPNMPVISLDGVVGTVSRIAGDRVDVDLTVDSGFGVDVVVERTGARGFVRGVGDLQRYKVSVEYVQRTDEVEQGDVLVTSGFGCRFPKGIPVARVTDVVKRDFGIYQQVEAEPTVDFSRLDEVLVVLTDTKDCTTPTQRKKH
ncbi:MAG TPA: rod shape-determining protein MreC [Polyangiaceae bacterium]|nr:rod shape-determining protein MreC [Polyangiaceae bacterium]